MSDASTPDGSSRSATERAVLECVADCRASYPAVVAHRTGTHVATARQQCERLADAGLLEAVSGEPLYRVTSEGSAAVPGGPETE